MALQMPLNYGEASLWFRLAGDPEEMAVTIGFHDTFASPGTPDEIAEEIYNAFVGTGKFVVNNALLNAYSVVRCDIRIARESPGLIFVGSYVSAYAGTRSTAGPPSNCALFVRKNTGLLGRRNKGRMYWPAGLLKSDDVSPTGQIEPGSALPTLQTRLTASFDAMVAAQLSPVILHTNGSPTPTPVTGLSVQPVIATQRRRLRP